MANPRNQNYFHLEYKPEPDTWHRHPFVVSWAKSNFHNLQDFITPAMIIEMSGFLTECNVPYSSYMMKEEYSGTGLYKFRHAGYRFLTENDAMLFWLRFKGE
jgi:hypothetical protein